MDVKSLFSDINTISSLESAKERIDDAFENKKAVIKLVESSQRLIGKDFGYIKESFENIAPSLFKTDEGRMLINKYIETVRGDKNLSRMYALYEGIRKTGKDDDVDYFVMEAVNTDWGVNKKTIGESTRKIGSLLSLGYILLGEDTDKLLAEDNDELYNAVSFIAENRKSHKNLSQYSSAVKVLKEHISKNEKSSNDFKSDELDEFAERLVREFNEKYSEIEGDEAEMLREFATSTDGEYIFNKYKKRCNSKLDEQRIQFEKDNQKESAEKIRIMQEKLSDKKYSPDTINEDVANLVGMMRIFD